jgi:hypothetical protein
MNGEPSRAPGGGIPLPNGESRRVEEMPRFMQAIEETHAMMEKLGEFHDMTPISSAAQTFELVLEDGFIDGDPSGPRKTAATHLRERLEEFDGPPQFKKVYGELFEDDITRIIGPREVQEDK